MQPVIQYYTVAVAVAYLKTVFNTFLFCYLINISSDYQYSLLILCDIALAE